MGDEEEVSVGDVSGLSVGDEEEVSVGDEGAVSSGDEEEESVVDKEEEDLHIGYVKEKFPRSKVDSSKFLVDYQVKHKAALKGPVLEIPIKVDTWNDKYLMREMKDIYNKVVPNVILHHRKLRNARTQ